MQNAAFVAFREECCRWKSCLAQEAELRRFLQQDRGWDLSPAALHGFAGVKGDDLLSSMFLEMGEGHRSLCLHRSLRLYASRYSAVELGYFHLSDFFALGRN
jgi:hypothetical protein